MKGKVTFIAILMGCMFGCNNNTSTNNQPATQQPTTNQQNGQLSEDSVTNIVLRCPYSNYIISNEELTILKENFKKEPFASLLDYNSFPNGYWIDACYLRNFKKAIDEYNRTVSVPSEQINNFWIWQCADNSTKNKVHIFLVPAIDKKPIWLDINDIEKCNPIFSNYDNDYNKVAKGMISNFNRKHRKEGIFNGKEVKNLSRSVRFSTCLLEGLITIISNNQARNVNGIRIYNSAYLNTDLTKPHPEGQFDKNQTTVTIVFTKYDGSGNIVDDTEVVKKYYDQAVRLKLLDGFNHGALCPNQCN